MMRNVFLILFISLLFCHCKAQTNNYVDGNYVTKGGWGSLKISTLEIITAHIKKVSYEIETSGGDISTCELSGEIQNGKSKPISWDKNNQCVIDFKTSDDSVEISSNTRQECQLSFCGARASFDGVYIKLKPECEAKSRGIAKVKFATLYNRKKYLEAFQTLEDLLFNCENILDWQELGNVKNDLAITQYHLYDYSECIKTLEPYAKEASMSDNEILKKYSIDAANADAELRLLRSARTNLKLCSANHDFLKIIEGNYSVPASHCSEKEENFLAVCSGDVHDTLSIKRISDNSAKFEVESIQRNFAECGASGVAVVEGDKLVYVSTEDDVTKGFQINIQLWHGKLTFHVIAPAELTENSDPFCGFNATLNNLEFDLKNKTPN